MLTESEFKQGKEAFLVFAHYLFERTKQAFPPCVSLWAKWNHEDLIPHLSDFDTRLICVSPVSPTQWIEFDRMTGELHLEITRTHPEWMRILEHTPGVTVTHEEMLDHALFHPETQQWTRYIGDEDWYPNFLKFNSQHVWSERHEFYFLRRFLYYYSPYIHGIDPPINLGCYQHKYALHSRLWHYFLPALQAALALVERRTVRGKFETLAGWLARFPRQPTLMKAKGIVERHYESTELSDERALLQLEDELYAFLRVVFNEVKESLTLIDTTGPADPQRYKKELSGARVDPLMIVYDGVRFSRIRRGRYYFYLNSPACFDAKRLIVYELKWLQDYFTAPLFSAYGKIKFGMPDCGLDEILEDMRAGMITAQEEGLIRRVFHLSCDPSSKGREREVLSELIEFYHDYHIILERILEDARLTVAACTTVNVTLLPQAI
jgi:hypothetical protein